MNPSRSLGRDEALRFVRRTMGQSKIAVFTELLGGDHELAARANAAFEDAYGEAVDRGEVEPIAGASGAIAQLREGGVLVCLTTGFAPADPRAGSSPPSAGKT